ncbi:MAG TPA: copper resistance protein CopC [Candidatus Thermoplasmatota archaeon]|nr:copper resistance protein CopC [Candidatus Thermoplasmatota archaeon]
MTGLRAQVGRIALACLAVLLVAVPVTAHSDLDSSDPSAGSQLPAAPGWVVLRFSGPIEPAGSTVTVTDTAGGRVDADDLRTTDAGRASPVLNISLRPDLPDGGYVVRWRILSDDGHPNSGEFAFAVGNETVPETATSSEHTHTGSVAGRALSYVGLALAFGAVAWRWSVRAGPAGLARAGAKMMLLGAGLLALGAALLFKATLDSTGLPAGVLAGSAVGRMLLLRLGASLVALLLAGLALLPSNPSRLGAPLAAAALVVAAIATAAIGHAATQGLPALALDAMHLVASTTWAGGLVLLLLALRMAHRAGWPAEDVRRMGLRFGTVALACVIVLFLTGVATALFILGTTAITDPLHLAGSTYGRLLLAKVLMAGLMVAIAAANRFVFLDPRREAGVKRGLASLGPDGTPSGLRRAVFVEALVGLAILVVAAFLTATSPTDHETDHEHLHGAHAAHVPHLHASASLPSVRLISHALHGSPMMVPPFLAPLHDGHEGGGLFDWYNIGIAALVLAVLGVVGFFLYRVAKRRRGE